MTGAGEFIDIPPENIDLAMGNYNPVVIITTQNAQSQCNAAPFAMCMQVCHDPPLVAFSVGNTKDTCRNVRQHGEFVLNVPGQDILKNVMVTARRFPPEVNELIEADLHELPGAQVAVPRIKECKLHFECKVEWIKEAANHFIVLGRVVSASAAKAILTDDFRVKIEELKPVHYLGKQTDTFLEVGGYIKMAR